jgi:hypothetical protein
METDKIGAVGVRVAENLRYFRGRVGVSELSRRLTELGRPILPSGITKIEQGRRRADPDDLVAIAIALEVNVNALLMPRKPSDDPVVMTEEYRLEWETAWLWAIGQRAGVHWDDDGIHAGWQTEPGDYPFALIHQWQLRVRPYEDDIDRDAWVRHRSHRVDRWFRQLSGEERETIRQRLSAERNDPT